MTRRHDARTLASERAALMERVHREGIPVPEGIRALRKSLGLTQDEFARHFRLTRRQVSELERGTANPTADLLNRIGKVFNLRVGFVSARPGRGDSEG